MSLFIIGYTNAGKVASVNFNRGIGGSPMWASLPFDSNSKTFVAKNEMDQLILSEAQSSSEWPLTLSDRPPTPEISQPDWKKFRRGMWPDAGYRRLVRDTSDKEGRIDLKIAAGVGTDDYTWLKMLWDSCVEGLTNKPSTTEISSWNILASSAAMPLSFGADGKMLLS